MSIYKGERRDVPDWTWADLAADAANENVAYRAGDHVGLSKSGQVEVIGHDPKLGVLVRYSHPRSAEPIRGTMCPNGALLFLPASQVARWPQAGTVAAEMLDEATERAEAIKRLMSQ